MSRTDTVAHDPSAPAGHLPGFAREEQRSSDCGDPNIRQPRPEETPMTDALIVIDMQQGSFGPTTSRHATAGLVGRLKLLADEVRAGGARSSSFSITVRRATRIIATRRAGTCCPTCPYGRTTRSSASIPAMRFHIPRSMTSCARGRSTG